MKDMKKYNYNEIEKISYHAYIKLMVTELNSNNIKSNEMKEFRFIESMPDVSYGGEIALSYRAIEFLKEIGLLNNGICPDCGKRPIDSTYTFTNGYNQSIKYNICKNCYKEGVRTSRNPNNKEGCFIATLCYGNYDAEEVLILRDYRDNYLKKYLVGRIFIRSYYWISPYVVHFLKDHNRTTQLIRKKFLDKFCVRLEKRKKGKGNA